MSIEKLLHEAISDNRTYKKKSIFKLKNDLIAKEFTDKELAVNSFTIGSHLYEHGINVPETYGVFLNKTKPLNYFLVMDFIEGQTFKELGNEVNLANKLLQKQLVKVGRAGVIPVDYSYPENNILTPQNEVYLIDFDEFYFGLKGELKDFIEKIKSGNLY